MTNDRHDPVSNNTSRRNNSLQQEESGVGSAYKSNEQMWKALAGEQLDDMMASPENTKKYLRDSSWKLRLAAISILRTVWKSYEELAITCEKMAFEDPHPQVRDTSLFTLACCFRATNDARIGSLLARIVYDTTFPDSFRESAYLGLFQLRGTSPLDTPLPRKQRFPTDVNWAFVESFLSDDDRRK